MTLIDEYRFRLQPSDFWCRAEEASLHAALNIKSESPGTETRRAWSNAIIADPLAYVNSNKIPIVLHWIFLRDGDNINDENLISLVGSLAPS
jgi:hypothetical protein